MSRLAAACCVFGLSLLGACDDPCTELARRICNCEADTNSRYACTANRITNQQGRIVVSEDDKEFCSTKLDTCTCSSMDENRLDECGFVDGDQ